MPVMHLLSLTLAFQLRAAALGGAAAAPVDAVADSARDARRARSEQASFERERRAALPWEYGIGGRCDVRIRRFCWWYDDATPSLPPEADRIVERRRRLIALLDSLSRRHPGDEWLAGMTVHYRVDGRQLAGADSAARACGATSWWCHALLGYAAQMRGDAWTADSSFEIALREMPDDVRCSWTDIHVLLPERARGRYETLPCSERQVMERRYWMLARPQLASPVNDWRTEFLARRVQSWLARRSLTPQTVSWGDDAEELLLRFGWPVMWSRVATSSAGLSEPGIIGHDPWPSFAFSPREALLDSLAASGDDGWELQSRLAESRYAPHGVRRVIPIAAQLARFRRGDSTLLAGRYAVVDDSLRAPRAHLAAMSDRGPPVVVALDSAARGVGRLMLLAAPRLAGFEIADSAAAILARSRQVYASQTAPGMLSDLLLYAAGGEPLSTLDSALARAIPGDSVPRSRPLGVFWESYRPPVTADSMNVAVTVERIDHGWFRSARQRLGLADADSPLRIRWNDARAVTSDVRTHAISLDLANLSAGRYRLTVSMSPAEGTTGTASREIELIDR